MSNELLVIGDMANVAEMTLSNALGFTKTVTRSFDDRFAKTGAKIGSIANVRLPAQFRHSSGVKIDVQALNDASRPIALDKNYQVSWAMDRAEAYLSIDEMQSRYITPAMKSLASHIDSDGRNLANRFTSNLVGTPGSSYTSKDTFADLLIAAREKIVENLGPTDEIFNMVAGPKFVGDGFKYFGTAPAFSANANLGDSVKSGKLPNGLPIAGFTIMEQQNLAKYTTGVYSGTPRVNGDNQAGSTLITDGWGATTTLDVGAVITVDGVFAVNAQTKQSLGYLQQFVVTAKNAAGATQALQVEPALVGPGEQRQNVSALPADNAAVTVVGASALAPTNFALGYHPLAFAFACADYTGASGDPTGAIAEGTASQRIMLDDMGLSMTMTSQFDISANKIFVRCDLLGGWAPIYPQLSVKALY
jgi:hypothetical protein